MWSHSRMLCVVNMEPYMEALGPGLAAGIGTSLGKPEIADPAGDARGHSACGHHCRLGEHTQCLTGTLGFLVKAAAYKCCQWISFLFSSFNTIQADPVQTTQGKSVV